MFTVNREQANIRLLALSHHKLACGDENLFGCQGYIMASFHRG
jgi:hypothetical protein